MNTVKCGINNCPSVFTTEEPVSPDVRYICKRHNKTEQKVFFQTHQFDKDLKRAGKPIGTTHIQRQGEVEDSDETREIWSELQEITKEKK